MPYKDPQKRKEYLETYKDKKRIQDRNYRLNNKEKIKLYFEAYKKTEKYKKSRLETYKRFRKNNKKSIKLSQQKYNSKPEVRIRILLRKRIQMALKNKGSKNFNKTIDFIGCSYKECILHLEKQFKPGMTWDNYGKNGWHIDHIRPCASFDLTDPIQQKQCFHYTNLQPLWANDNLKKGASYSQS